MLVLFTFVVIVQSDHIIDLIKDFSALTVISQLDDLVFFLARAGFIGRDDSLSFNLNFPLCPVLEAIGNDSIVLGDGTCDSGLYNTYDCGYENGDCEKSQLGQDLVFHGAFDQTSSQVKIFSVLSLDGSTMAVGLPATNAKDIFGMNSGGRVRILK